jgi:hypothetical protein
MTVMAHRPGHDRRHPRMRQSCHGQRLPGALSQPQCRREKRPICLDLRRQSIAMGQVFLQPARFKPPTPRPHAGAFA